MGITGEFFFEHRRKTRWLTSLYKDIKPLAEKDYSQSQSRKQLMEKSRELQRDIYIAFMDSTKAYETVNQEILTLGFLTQISV